MRVRASFDATGDSIDRARGPLETLLGILEAVPSPWFALEAVLKGIAWAMERIAGFAGRIADWWTGQGLDTLPDQRAGVPTAFDVPEPQATPTLRFKHRSCRSSGHNLATGRQHRNRCHDGRCAASCGSCADGDRDGQSNRIGLNELGALGPTGNAAGGINIQALNVTVQGNGEDAAEQGRIAGRAAMDAAEAGAGDGRAVRQQRARLT